MAKGTTKGGGKGKPAPKGSGYSFPPKKGGPMKGGKKGAAC